MVPVPIPARNAAGEYEQQQQQQGASDGEEELVEEVVEEEVVEEDQGAQKHGDPGAAAAIVPVSAPVSVRPDAPASTKKNFGGGRSLW
jgi:hypothetical protein